MPRFAVNDGIQLAFDDLGGAGGDPLLLVMGLGTSRFWWPDALVGALIRHGFHVVAYDQRDAGQSTHLPARPAGAPIAALLRPAPREKKLRSAPGERELRSAPGGKKPARARQSAAYSGEDLADDAVAVLDALGWQHAHLFGHSMGGLVAQRIAIRHPGRVRTLTTSSAVPSDARGLGVLRYLHLAPLARFARLRCPDTPQGNLDLALAVARLMAAPGQHLEEDDVRAFVDKEAAHQVVSFRDYQAQSRQVGAKWHGGRLDRITAPTLVLHGEQDPLLRVAAARYIAAAVPGARLRTVPGVGHFLTGDIWETYAAELRALAAKRAG